MGPSSGNARWSFTGGVMNDEVKKLLDQREILIDQINILQAELLKHGIPLPPVPEV
jgi:hypothetical protein